MRYLGRRRSFVLLTVTTTAMLAGSGALFSRLRAQETHAIKEISPGLSLLSVSTTTPNGPLRYWLVKAGKPLWNLDIEVANRSDVFKKRSVRNLIQQAGATVAVNGGFFAYGGAAVGAVKQSNEWHRLPWKSRTALGWDQSGAQMGPLSGRCVLTATLTDGTSQSFDVPLNGFTLPGTHTPITNGLSVLTRRFKEKITLKPEQSAVLVRNGEIIARGLTGEFSWPLDALEGDFYVVASGLTGFDARTNPVKTLNWKVVLNEGPTTGVASRFTAFPTILGAGPRLVDNGQVRTTEKEEDFRPDVVARGPRTAVGWDKEGNWLLLVADGRQAVSVGLTIPETATLFQQLGAIEAMNLDGGSSTQLVINGELVNTPSGFDPVNPLRPREVMVSNALVLKAK
jgi:ligand-binding SRPBCC domain-containing protein